MKSNRAKTRKMSRFTATERKSKCLHFSIVVNKATIQIQIVFSLQETCLRLKDLQINQEANFEILSILIFNYESNLHLI